MIIKIKPRRKLTVKINTHGNLMPQQHGEWIDLYTAEHIYMRKGEYMIIPLGYSMELPKGYYAQIVPRSSACAKFGVMMANSVGVIENDYNGPDDIWGFPAYAIQNTFIPEHTRICQFHLVKQDSPVKFVEDDLSGNSNRGGYGSTGSK